MSKLIASSVILTASRLSNFAIQLFSPLLLVRILEVEEYGQYQEFMVYAALLTMICEFSFNRSLSYFIPRYPERERSIVSVTSVITFSFTIACVVGLLLAKPLLLRLASYDFVAPLGLYVFFFVNLSWLESYWIAKRAARMVLYYSALRLVVRVGVLLLVAYVTQDVISILWSLVAVEATRAILVLVYFSRQGMFVANLRWSDCVEQLRYSAPLGASAVVRNSGRNVGKIVISATLGPSALAYYAAGSYLQPIIRVARSGIEDALYPELVRAQATPERALHLWQRVNVLNCAIFFPAFIVLIYFAEPIVTTLFTEAYRPAVGVFQVYAFFLLRRCFSTDVLIRATGKTGFMLWGTLGALTVNVVLMFPLARWLGIIGPAIAFVVAEVALEIYYANHAMRKLKLRIADLSDWASIGRIVASCILALPLLALVLYVPMPQMLRLALGGTGFLVGSLWIAYRLGVTDIGRAYDYVGKLVIGWLRLSRTS